MTGGQRRVAGGQLRARADRRRHALRRRLRGLWRGPRRGGRRLAQEREPSPSGDAGDELFGGYRRYLGNHYLARFDRLLLTAKELKSLGLGPAKTKELTEKLEGAKGRVKVAIVMQRMRIGRDDAERLLALKNGNVNT